MTQILLIEDEPQILRMYERIFSAEGFGVTTATDGAEGLTKISQLNPDLILLDIMMPLMNGLEVLKKVKENPTTNHIPVVVLTNMDDNREMSVASLMGAAAFIVKSNSEPEDVVNRVKKILNPVG